MLGERQKSRINKALAELPASCQIDAYYVDRFLNSRETGRGYPFFVAWVDRKTGEKRKIWELGRGQTISSVERRVEAVHAYLDSLFDGD